MNRAVQFEMAINELTDKFKKEMTQELKKHFVLKNKVYGDDYFSNEYSPIERWLSVKRKIARLKSHYDLFNDINLPDETLKDTWQDLTVYCVMELMILKEQEKNERIENKRN